MTLEPFTTNSSQTRPTPEGQEYLAADGNAYFVPSNNRKTLIVAPEESIADIIALAGEPPPFRRDVERIVSHTDADRDVTIICTPNSLFSEGRNLFAGELPKVREPLFWFLGDELSAVALSAHWDDNFFYEIVAVPTLETSPERAARILSDRLREESGTVKRHISSQRASEYSAEVVSRFPAMLETLAQYSRSGFDKDCAVVRGYLPVAAGHNLLLAGELTLAEASSQGRPVADFDRLSPGNATSPDTAGNEKKSSVRERLKYVTSLRFGRETLEAALDQLSKDVGIGIVIRGQDLQAEGITKNQQFGIDVENKPAEEILVEILRLANPDKTATGPNDEKQKFVYVVRPGDDGEEQIVVTTRAAAAARGDELPEVFR
jgi:hypothetical protein